MRYERAIFKCKMCGEIIGGYYDSNFSVEALK